VFLYTLEIKVFVVAPNTSTKLVLVLPVASLVSVMMKASSEEALCPLVEIVRDTGRLR
jgi:hypothetical protein